MTDYNKRICLRTETVEELKVAIQYFKELDELAYEDWRNNPLRHENGQYDKDKIILKALKTWLDGKNIEKEEKIRRDFNNEN